MNKADRPAISSYDKTTLNADGSADLYFGPKAPAGLESNWVDTSASKGWRDLVPLLRTEGAVLRRDMGTARF